jgi:glycosyltransferase involved in cell wall biosynthesis
MAPVGESPLVSVITPSFQQGRYIGETIRSVADQDYPNVEHIVVDGGSTDETLDVLRAAGASGRMRWISAPDKGQGDAINKGMQMARGDIVAWLNSDDVYLSPRVISTVVEAFRGGAMAVTGGGYWISEGGARIKPIRVDPSLVSREAVRHVDWFLQPATFYTRDLALRHPLDTSLNFAMDWDMLIRMTAEVDFTVLDLPLAGYRVHAGGKTVGGGISRQRELLRVLQRHAPGALRVRAFAVLVALHELAAQLPGPLPAAAYRLLTLGARATNRVSGGRGLPS